MVLNRKEWNWRYFFLTTSWYSGSSPNEHSHKLTALLTATFTKPRFYQLHLHSGFLHFRKQPALVMYTFFCITRVSAHVSFFCAWNMYFIFKRYLSKVSIFSFRINHCPTVSDNTLIVFLMVAETKKRKRVDEEASGGRRAKTRRGQGGECVYITMTKWKNMCVGEKQ